MSAVELAPGKWELEKSENFDNYMKAVGVGMATRLIANRLKPTQEISIADGVWTIKSFSTFKNTEVQFKLGETIDETTGDGRQVKAIFSMDGNKLIQAQKGEVDSTMTREFASNSFVMTLEAKGVVCTRQYKKST